MPKTITIQTRDGSKQVEASAVAGPLTIHRTAGVARGSWTITHAASGYAVTTAPTQATARQLASLLATAGGDLWATATAGRVLAVLRAACVPILRDVDAARGLGDTKYMERVLSAIGNALAGDPEPGLAPRSTNAWLLRQLADSAPNGAGV